MRGNLLGQTWASSAMMQFHNNEAEGVKEEGWKIQMVRVKMLWMVEKGQVVGGRSDVSSY